MIAVDLSKQQALDANRRAINKLILQQTQIEEETQESISFLKKSQAVLDFSQRTVKVL